MQVVGIPVSAPRTDPASLGPTRKRQTDIGISFSSDAVGLFEAPTPMPSNHWTNVLVFWRTRGYFEAIVFY
jgi:hypothetical protein